MDMNKIYDLIIVGCGPAGLSAAVNARIREKDFLLLGGDFCSPKLHKAPWIDNYLGIYHLTGEELRQNYLKHLKALDIKIHHRRVDTIYPVGETFQVLSKTDVFTARVVILATGLSSPKYLPGEQELLGKGVGYCATCDGPLYKGKKVIMIGEVEEAEEEANFLADICQEVLYIPRYGEPKHLKDKVKVQEGKPRAIHGEGHFTALETDRGKYEADGLFIIRQVTPVQEILPGLEFEGNVIKVDRAMATNIPGVYAAGDCTGAPYQLAKAVGEGLVAALSAVKYIDMGKK
jgi:thioredoxin reductase (NADPH)